ncbi:AAA family ATPase [Moraxella bovis]|uniref:AAA family ATPase n=1 Tax=Moraxella bovis TaxID=476 RepID=UPI0022269947|nr:AAA family ATPase [Moraxella bovis]UZA19155.1 AAA family ATPase [Moraxella bovis]
MNTMLCTLNQVTEVLPILLDSKIVPFIHGSPALGKSAIAKQIAGKFQLEVIDLRLTEMDSSDLNGLPYFKEGKSTFLPFDTFPIENTPIPKGKKGWLLLLDEFNSALPSVQASAYKLVLDRQVGQHKLHKKCFIIACGNSDSDNAIVNTMSSALISRFAHFYIQVDNTEWQEWAVANGIHPMITAFLNFKPNLLYTFNPDSDTPYASPRTWQMMSKVLDNDTPLVVMASLLGLGVATELKAFMDYHKELPTIEDILKDPENYPIPDMIGIQWATLTMIISHLDRDMDKLTTYLKRFSPEMHMVALREIKGRYGVNKITQSKLLREWLTDLGMKAHGHKPR